MSPSPISEWTGKIVDWDREKGYGFVQLGNRRVFLHRRDFIGLHRTPVPGDEVRFTLGHDSHGRVCAENAFNARGGLGISLMGLLSLAALLVLPVIARQRLVADVRWIAAYGLCVSVFTYWTYASDKQRAKSGEWRVSEAQLHFLELLGGWPGAWLAQRRLRHKCSKGSYQFVFWLIVLSYQFTAFDSLHDWKLSQAALRKLAGDSPRQKQSELSGRRETGVRGGTFRALSGKE